MCNDITERTIEKVKMHTIGTAKIQCIMRILNYQRAI